MKRAKFAGDKPKRIEYYGTAPRERQMILPCKRVATLLDTAEVIKKAEKKFTELAQKEFPKGTEIYLELIREEAGTGNSLYGVIKATVECPVSIPICGGLSAILTVSIAAPIEGFVIGLQEHPSGIFSVPWSSVIGKSLPEGE